MTTMQIRPIRTDKDPCNALAEIEKLLGRAHWYAGGISWMFLPRWSRPMRDGVGPSFSGNGSTRWMCCIDAIEELGHSQAELADILGSRSRASEVLARRRRLTLEMIQKDQCRVGRSRPISSSSPTRWPYLQLEKLKCPSGRCRAWCSTSILDYRLVAAVQYQAGVLVIRFFGTHGEYNKIDAEKM